MRVENTNGSQLSVGSSSASGQRRFQLVPRSMVDAQQQQPMSEEMRRIQEKIQVIAASERKIRSESDSHLDYRVSSGSMDGGRARSQTGESTRSASIRIQLVPKTGSSSTLPPLPDIVPGPLRRINRSLTAVTEEEVRVVSECQSDIEEEDEQHI